MLSPVLLASCSLVCLVGFGVAANAALSVSNCLALIVVRGPLLLPPTVFSSGVLLSLFSCPEWLLSPSMLESFSMVVVFMGPLLSPS